MSKVIILGDTHCGARNASTPIADYQLNFLSSQLIPYMKKHKLDTIIQLGDVFDTRKYSNHVILDRWQREFFNVLSEKKIKMHVILGNHDIAYRNSLKVNSPAMFLSHYKNIIIHDEPSEVDIGVNQFLFLPWICSENYDKSIDLINSSKCSCAFGHLELANFEMYRGQMNYEGMSKDTFKSFQYVFSGHFHHKSDDGQIYYLGSPFEFTWADYNDPRGFHVFDTQTLEIEFVQNKYNMFYRLDYDDKDKGNDYWKSFDPLPLKGKYVKVVVTNKTDPYQFDRLVDVLYNAETADFKIVEVMSDFDADSIDDDDLEMEDSMSLVDSYIDAADFDGDKDKLKGMLKSLYVESLSVLE